MGITGTERQQRFIELAAAHAEDFKTRVAQHDRENTFPFENVEAMKASGYTNMTAPEELGGGGADVLDLVLAQEGWPGGICRPLSRSTCTCSAWAGTLISGV